MSLRPKVFIHGISGLLGYSLALHLRKNFLVAGTCFRNQVHIPEAQVFPITLKSLDVLEVIVRAQAPDFIIGAVGMSDRKEVEEQPKLSDMLNVMLPVSMAALAGRIKAKYIALSCAEIYDGEKGFYSEEDNAFTLTDSVGKQKITAASFIRSQSLESTALRIGRVLGVGHPFRLSFFDRIRNSAADGKPYEASKVKGRSYISTRSFVLAVEKILGGEFPAKHRVFHVGGANMTEFEMVESWYKLMGRDPKLVSELRDTKRDLTLNSKLLETQYPGWKAETKEELFLNLLDELNPAVGTKKWQRQLQALQGTTGQ